MQRSGPGSCDLKEQQLPAQPITAAIPEESPQGFGAPWSGGLEFNKSQTLRRSALGACAWCGRVCDQAEDGMAKTWW